MSRWPATRARRVLKALERTGWRVKREAKGSHKILEKKGRPDFVWAFHSGVEIGASDAPANLEEDGVAA